MATLNTLLDRLSQRTGDYFEQLVTTAITNTNSVVSTHFSKFVNRDDVYNRWWLYVVTQNNAGEYRKVNDYTASSTTIQARGGVFNDDVAALAKVQLHRYDRDNKIRALNQSARKTYPALFRLLRDHSLSANNILPNPHFQDWAVSTIPDYYAATNVTANAETTTYRGYRSTTALKVTASVANGYVKISSTTFPKLLDLMGKSVSGYVWAYPQTANDPALIFYTLKADGTEQNLVSATACPASKWTLIKHEDQGLNDDLVQLDIRFRVATNAQYVIFDNARLIGLHTQEYILPLDFQNPLATVDRVSIQTRAIQDEAADDTGAGAVFEPLYGWDVVDDSETKYLVTGRLPTGRLLRIEGKGVLESTLANATDTITIEDPHLDLLIEYAAYAMFDMEAGLPSSMDRDFLRGESAKYFASYQFMKRNLKMTQLQSQTKFDPRMV